MSRLHLGVPAEGPPHPIPGAGAGEPQGGAGYQKQAAPPAGEEADGDQQTGESRGRWKRFLGTNTTSAPDIKIKRKHLDPSIILLFFFFLQTEKNVKLDENLKKVQQENEDLKARMERHAALSR